MTKRRHLCVCAAVLCCAPDRTYETAHGLDVFDTVGLYDQADLEIATAILIDEAGRGRQVLRKLSVRFQEDPVYLGGEQVGGAYHPELSLAVVQTISECLGGTTFVHELAHHLEWTLDGDIDYGHEGEPWVPGGWVREAEKATTDALCP